MALPGITNPLRFSEVTILDKSEYSSDHNCVSWKVVAQPPCSLTEEEKINKACIKPYILKNVQVYSQILTKIFNIINVGAPVPAPSELEAKITEADKLLFSDR